MYSLYWCLLLNLRYRKTHSTFEETAIVSYLVIGLHAIHLWLLNKIFLIDSRPSRALTINLEFLIRRGGVPPLKDRWMIRAVHSMNIMFVPDFLSCRTGYHSKCNSGSYHLLNFVEWRNFTVYTYFVYSQGRSSSLNYVVCIFCLCIFHFCIFMVRNSFDEYLNIQGVLFVFEFDFYTKRCVCTLGNKLVFFN